MNAKLANKTVERWRVQIFASGIMLQVTSDIHMGGREGGRSDRNVSPAGNFITPPPPLTDAEKKHDRTSFIKKIWSDSEN